MALSSGYTYLLAVFLAPQWIKERGIIDMCVRVLSSCTGSQELIQ